METTNIRREIQYTGFDNKTWEMDITYSHKIVVRKNGERRVYNSPEPITKIEHDTEYVHLTLESNGFLQFKFEENSFLVGDLFDEDGECIGSFSSHVFGEE